jgi:hypothetical protein
VSGMDDELPVKADQAPMAPQPSPTDINLNLLLSDPEIRRAIALSLTGLVEHLPGKERTARWTRVGGFVAGGSLGLAAIISTVVLVSEGKMGADAGAFVFGAVITAALAMVREGLAGE